MSKCHFPQDNYTVILDPPQISHLANTLRLIETNNNLPDPSILSLNCLDHPQQPSTNLLHFNELDEDSLGLSIQQNISEDDEGVVKKKKTGCTCKKTNCIKMYC